MLILYGTQGCHLCDDAEALLHQVARPNGLQAQPPEVFHEPLCEPHDNELSYKKVDIANDDALFARYGWHIPVLRCDQSNSELRWPFDLPQLRTFLRDLPRDDD